MMSMITAPILQRKNSRFILFKYICCLATVPIIIACFGPGPKVVMYKGPAKVPEEHAIIQVDPSEERGTLEIQRVDGEMTVNLLTHFFTNKWASAVFVMPGKHDIDLRFNSRSLPAWYALGGLWMVTEPGGVYVIKVLPKGYGVRMWIENARTGIRVGGNRGSIDEPKQ